MLKFFAMLASFKKLVPEPVKIAYHFIQALLGALIFLFPAYKLKIIGVTGTDGKTTTIHLIHHILNESGKSASMISTVEAKIGDKKLDTGLHVTTPSPLKVQYLLRKIANSGSEYAVLEVTSHGLAQERVAFVKFFGAVITNITHEHLDYHKTYEAYIGSKAKLLNGVKFRVLNADDASFRKLRAKGGGQLVSYGIRKETDFQAKDVNLARSGTAFEIHFKNKKSTKKVGIKTSLQGEYNIYNILAAFALATCLGVSSEKIAGAVATFRGVPGRMQYVDEGQKFDVVVDFAHTPVALEKALKALNEFKKGRTIAVFGSAGERDVGKRSMMGKIATELADASVFTAEDPRNEDVNRIINQISQGALNGGGIPNRTFWKIADRAAAINTAIQTLASEGDTVVIFGKGHEKSMNIAGKEYPWSDEEVARNALKLRVRK
jgi:UDP-N-acetylmuramoyl-L-alanyl-D-glutamate--2,6-diaminopimelate ligase